MSGQLLSINDAAEYLAVSTKTIRRRIADGTLTAYRSGPRLIRIDMDELNATLRPMVPTHVAPGSDYVVVADEASMEGAIAILEQRRLAAVLAPLSAVETARE